MTAIPILKCFPASETQVKAWCPFCKTWHLHGYLDDLKNNRMTTRCSAHCTVEDSPFKKSGYRLKMMSKLERKEIAKSIGL